MTNEEFLKDICPNHTDKSKWNKSELLHILDKYQALQLQQTGVSTCFLEDCEDHLFEIKYKQVSCCKIAPITNENYCPNCGKKILK